MGYSVATNHHKFTTMGIEIRQQAPERTGDDDGLQGERAPIVESTVRKLDRRLPPDTEVFGIHDGHGCSVAWPLAEVERLGEMVGTLGTQEVRVRWNKELKHLEGLRARWFLWSSYYRGTELP
jgi:hypothetical protein